MGFAIGSERRRAFSITVLLVAATVSACTAEQRRRIKWTGRRGAAMAACAQGAGPKLDPKLVEDFCSCVFDRVSRRWDPEMFFDADGQKEFQLSGIPEACGAPLSPTLHPR